jgi:hypothetical protein
VREAPAVILPERGACAVKPTAGVDGAQTLALCWSEGRTLKTGQSERAQTRFLTDIENLRTSYRFGQDCYS